VTDVLTRTSVPVLPAVVEPAPPFAGTVAERLVLAVAPSTGRFRPLLALTGEAAHSLESGELMGHITGGKDRADEVRAPTGAHLRDLLVRPGQLVAAGQGLAWLERPS
jgi:biotin carboxyl carrier protein